MKKNLLFAALLFASGANAQITITNADMPSVNDTFRLSTTVDSWGIDASLTGANYTWDFSFLEFTSQDVDTAVSVTSTPPLYQFYFNNIILYPEWKADYAIRGQDFSLLSMISFTKIYDFYKKSSSAFENVGFGTTINGLLPASIRKMPVEVVYPMPLNYLDTYTNFSAFEMNIPSLMNYRQTKDKSGEVDGWGTITTPFGTFNALRVKITQDIVDSIYLDTLGFPFEIPRPTETQYHWLAPGEDVPVLQINETSGFITSIIYKDKVHPVGLDELGYTIDVSVFPNPSVNVIHVNAGEVINSYQLTDLTGKIVLSQNINAKAFVIDATMIASGNYILNMKSNKGIAVNKVSIAAR